MLLDTGRGLVLDVRGGRPAEIEVMRDALGLRAPVDLNVGGLALGADALGILPLGRAAKYSVEGRVGLRWWEQSA